MSNEQHQALLTAADFFNQSARKLLTVDGRLHAETLIASVARMAGSMMYRSFNFDKAIEPGTAVLSDQANIHGPKLMNVMFVTLQQLGDKVGQDNLNSEYASAKFSQLTFRESHDRLAPFFLKYCEVIHHTPRAVRGLFNGNPIPRVASRRRLRVPRQLRRVRLLVGWCLPPHVPVWPQPIRQPDAPR